jgi:hypothetical protein
MHGVEAALVAEGLSHLPRRRARWVEDEGFGSRAQIAKDGIEIGDVDIDED